MQAGFSSAGNWPPLAKKRMHAGLNQSELASLCDKDLQSIQRLEKGGMNPTAYYLLELTEALKIPVKELLEFRNNQTI